MRETLLIRFAAFPATQVQFAAADERGKLSAAVRTGSLTEAAIHTAGRRVVILVPAADLLLTEVHLPNTSRQRVRKAIPFALEDALAQDIEDLHFAIANRHVEGRWSVAVVSRRRMEYWLELLREAGIFPDRVLPEPLLLPLQPAQASLLLEDEQALLRDQPCSAQTSDIETLPALLELMAGRHEDGLQIQVWHCSEALPEWPAQVTAEVLPCSKGALGVLAQGLVAADNPIDLLQGAYSRKEHYGQLWRPWRAAAALLAVGILISGIQQIFTYRQLAAESKEMSARIEKLYRETFPGGRMVNPRVQMEQQLTALRRQQGTGGADFLGLVGKMGGALAAAQGIELTGANFRDGRLDLELTASDVQSLDRLKQQLNEAGGLNVDIQSATAGADRRVQGRLRVQGTES